MKSSTIAWLRSGRLKKTGEDTMADIGDEMKELKDAIRVLISQQNSMATCQDETTVEVLKRLDQLETSQGKRSANEETPENQEDDETFWDGEVSPKDQEKKTKTEKVSPDSEAMKRMEENMAKMNEAIKKSRGAEDYLFEIGGTSRTTTPLPPKFKISELVKFDGTEEPKCHLRQFKSAMELLGLSHNQMAHAFPLSLVGLALRWFHSIESGKMKIWEDIVREFVLQYSYNSFADVTLRDLEITKQKSNEVFSEFIVRWRRKAASMPNRPSEKDQVKMVIGNLLPIYQSQMLAVPLIDFEQLGESGNRVEDAIHNGILSDGRYQKK